VAGPVDQIVGVVAAGGEHFWRLEQV
jgi:hypothetical protein